MPEISRFYGIIISMLYSDKMRHHLPHIHAKYSGRKAIFTIDDGTLLKGKIPVDQTKQVQAWIALHKEELLEDLLFSRE